MIVENHDSGDHASSNHEHDAVEIGPEIYMIMIGQLIRSVLPNQRSVVGNRQHLSNNCTEQDNCQQQVNTWNFEFLKTNQIGLEI